MSSRLGRGFNLNLKRTSKPRSKEDCYKHEISDLQYLIETVHPDPSTIQVFISVRMESSTSSNILSGAGAKYSYGTVEHKQHMSVNIFQSTSYSQSQALPKKRHLCASSAVNKGLPSHAVHVYDTKNTHSDAAC